MTIQIGGGFSENTRISMWGGGSKSLMTIQVGDVVVGVSQPTIAPGFIVPNTVTEISHIVPMYNSDWLDITLDTSLYLDDRTHVSIRTTGWQYINSYDVGRYKNASSLIFSGCTREKIYILKEDAVDADNVLSFRARTHIVPGPIAEKIRYLASARIYNISTVTGNFFANQFLVGAANFDLV